MVRKWTPEEIERQRTRPVAGQLSLFDLNSVQPDPDDEDIDDDDDESEDDDE